MSPEKLKEIACLVASEKIVEDNIETASDTALIFASLSPINAEKDFPEELDREVIESALLKYGESIHEEEYSGGIRNLIVIRASDIILTVRREVDEEGTRYSVIG